VAVGLVATVTSEVEPETDSEDENESKKGSQVMVPGQ